MTHYTSEASPQTDERVVRGRSRRIAPVACIESGMVNHSVEWDRGKGNSLAVKAPPTRSRHERTTDCCRGLKQARGVGSGEHRPDVSARLLFQLLPTGFSNRHLRQHFTSLLGQPPNSLTQGLRTAWFCTRTYSRILRPGLGSVLPELSPPNSSLRRSFDKLDQEVTAWIQC